MASSPIYKVESLNTADDITGNSLQKRYNTFSEFYDKYAPAYYGEIKRRLYKDDVSQKVLEDVLKDVYNSFDQLDTSKERLFITVLKLVRKEVSKQKINLVSKQILHSHTIEVQKTM